MKMVRANESEIIFKMPAWFRMFAWICVLAFSLIFVFGLLMAILTGDGIVGYWISALGFALLLLGIWMATIGIKLTFDKNRGFVILEIGRMPIFFWIKRRRIISKEEAGSVSTTYFDSPKFIWSWSVFFSIFTLGAIPTARNFATRYYQVKVLTKSGKEVELLTSSKKEMVDYLVQRIEYLSTISTSETHTAKHIKAEKSPVKQNKNKPVYSGVIMISMGVLVLIPLGVITGNASAEGFFMINIASIVAITGGVFAISRRKWWLALVGAICVAGVPLFFIIISPNLGTFLFVLPLVAGILAGFLILISRKDFIK